ncbi:sucrase ferredoxin [Modestobacter lapidis]|nr:sucrase ferredoxin [Modestobacter lapidis]
MSAAPGPARPGGARRARPAGRLDHDRCSVQALLRGDSPSATAPPAQQWLLVEQPGPWGRDALLESRFDHRVASRLAARAREAGVRVQLVRRPGRRATDAALRWALADVRPGRETVRWATRATDAELLHVPWDDTVGEPADTPTYLVCTHGAHDTCCAVRGRPLAQGLPVDPADVWETSHLGGDRFAANVLVLPHGFVYGQVPGDGADLVRAHTAGRVALPWLRGRAGLGAPAQAGQQHARTELGLLGVGDLVPRAVRSLPSPAPGAERWSVTLAGPAGDVVVTVESRVSAEAHRLTCGALQPGHWRTWHPLDLRVVAPA